MDQATAEMIKGLMKVQGHTTETLNIVVQGLKELAEVVSKLNKEVAELERRS